MGFPLEEFELSISKFLATALAVTSLFVGEQLRKHVKYVYHK